MISSALVRLRLDFPNVPRYDYFCVRSIFYDNFELFNGVCYLFRFLLTYGNFTIGLLNLS